MKPPPRGLRLAGLLALVAVALVVLEGLPRVRERVEASLFTAELGPGALLQATAGVGVPFHGAIVLLLDAGEWGATGLVLEGGLNDREPAVPGPEAAGENGLALVDGRAALLDAGAPPARVRWGGPVSPSVSWLLVGGPVPGGAPAARPRAGVAGEGAGVEDAAAVSPGEVSSSSDEWEEVATALWVLRMEEPHEAAGLLASHPEALLFSGHSGWGPAQLEREARAGAWLPASLDPARLTAPDGEERGSWPR